MAAVRALMFVPEKFGEDRTRVLVIINKFLTKVRVKVAASVV
jgi:hypothetical protein